MKEKHYRSVIKGATWRILASADTIFLSWLFTGHIGIAFKIGAIEVFTKIFLFYLHERVWLKLKFARTQIVLADGTITTRDKHYRSVVKGASYRFFGTMDTMVIAFFITGNYTQALSIGFTEVITKIGLFYLHERIWYQTKFGVAKKISSEQVTDSSTKIKAVNEQMMATSN